jgi:hypothetical protein
MIQPRFTLSCMMAATYVLGVEFFITMGDLMSLTEGSLVFTLGVVPVLSLLVIVGGWAIVRFLQTGERPSAFLAGFLNVGFAAALCVTILGFLDPEPIIAAG